jgi:NADH:ubiquinone oxidoreductase subunit F (NADH-binding)
MSELRLLRDVRTDRPATLAEHHSTHGPLPFRDPDDLIDAVEQAGVTGRGGAAFPVATKMRTVSTSRGRPVVVVNAAESEPASQKDRWLSARVPHLVLDGADAAARAVGGSEIVVWLHRGADQAEQALRTALAERKAAGVGTRRTRLVMGPERYVAGEASAVVAHLSGGPALPTMSPHRTAERGVRGRPTLLANAETFAHVALVARHGAGWFRELGTAEEPGTMLATVRGAVHRPGVVEVALGTSLDCVLAAAGGPSEELGALLVGGYGGTWLDAGTARSAALSRTSLRPLGVDLGVGLVLALPASRCPLAETERLLSWLAAESTGQCGPCVNGLPALAGRFAEAVAGRGPEAVGAVERLAGLVAGRGACHHPDGTARLARSALQVFGPHLAEHERRGPCSDVASAPLAPLPAHHPVAAREGWR